MKKAREITRNDQNERDDRLFVLATEDTYAPEQYFSMFRIPRIHLRLLPTKDGRSSPRKVLDRLHEYKSEYELNDDDQLWILCDKDRWTLAELHEVCRESKQSGYHLANSTPCFDYWLLLHFQTPGKQFSNCRKVGAEIRRLNGSFNKSKLDLSMYLEHVNAARERAQNGDSDALAPFPATTGTHVYKILNEISLPTRTAEHLRLPEE